MKSYVLVGTGSRGHLMYAQTITQRFGDVACLVGLYDINPKRCRFVRDQLKLDLPCYQDFDRMLDELKPDAAIITTVDRFHNEYIVKCLERNIEVISEKPMTIDARRCKEILDAEKRTQNHITVTFNCRFMPHMAKIKELLREGVVGEVLNVDFEWILDTSHGADYFRRWHREMENSGGLLVHKATHHFDIINWLIEQDPETVYANGSLRYYGNRSDKREARCTTCNETASCPYAYTEANDPYMKGMYFDAEDADGYFRDRCIYSDKINIYDSMSLSVKYNKGALLTYSLVAHSPYEGWKLSISGTKGRLETYETSSGIEASDPLFHIKIFNRQGDIIHYDMKQSSGMHGGGDERMLQMLLRHNLPDPLNQYAGSRDGSMSILIGIAANQSIATGQVVKIKDLVDIENYYPSSEPLHE